MPHPARARVALLLALPLPLAGCLETSPWRAHEPPWGADSVAGARRVRATRADGTVLVLEAATIEPWAGELRGTRADGGAAERVPLADLAQLETQRLEKSRVLGNVAIGAGVVAVGAVVLVGSLALAFVSALG